MKNTCTDVHLENAPEFRVDYLPIILSSHEGIANQINAAMLTLKTL